MTTSQFDALIRRIDAFEQRVDERVRKAEVRVAMLFAGVGVVAFLGANGYLKLN